VGGLRPGALLGEGEQAAAPPYPLGPTNASGAGRSAAARGARTDGIVTVRISPETGLLASSDNPNGIMEKFIEGNLPKSESYEGPNQTNPMNDGDKPLF